MAGKDDWVEDVRRWCFEGSRPAESAVEGGDSVRDTQVQGASHHIDAVAAVCPWQPTRAEAIDLHDCDPLVRRSGKAA